MRIFATVAGALALFSSVAHAADVPSPTVYKPAGAWTLDVGDDYCRISRPFGSGSSQITFAMERIQPIATVRVLLIGGSLKVYRNADQLEYTLLPSGGARKGPFWRSETADGLQFLSMGEVLVAPAPPLAGKAPAGPPPALDYGKPMPLPPYDRSAELAFAQGINALSITGGVSTPVEIDTGGLKGPVDALQKCADDLLAYWKLDPAKHRTMTRSAQPATAPSEWLPSSTIGFGDFPKLADSANQIRVIVNAEGKPTSCTIARPSLEKKTNDAICKGVMAKGQFFPALDAAGQPMDSYWVGAPFMLMPPFKT